VVHFENIIGFRREPVGYRETYAGLSEDEILQIASDYASLEQDAQVALTVELSRRNLTQTDVLQHRERVASFKPEDAWGKDEDIARSVNGFGTTIYGKRDFEPDGSFVTTKWIVGLFFPLIPLASMRVKVIKGGWFRYDSYLVRQRTRPNWKQAACVYCYFLLLLFVVQSGLPSAVIAALLGIVLPSPWLLRKLARARSSRASAQQGLGSQS
jgi:hypothetical protein